MVRSITFLPSAKGFISIILTMPLTDSLQAIAGNEVDIISFLLSFFRMTFK